MKVAAVVSDLLLFSRIDAAASAAGATLTRVDSPADLGPGVDLVLVDWSARRPGWGDALARSRDESGARVVLFGQHTDLAAHADARATGFGPMWARSKILTALPSLLRSADRG